MQWTIKKPDGTTYTRENLDEMYRAYGATRKMLEARGWVFTEIPPKATPKPAPKLAKKKDTSHEDD